MEAPVITAPPSLGAEASRYVFDRRLGAKGAYRDRRTGRVVAWSVVREVLDKTLDSAEQAVRQQVERLRTGRIDLRTFQRFVEPEIKRIHLASYALERGGWAQMSAADYGRVGRILYNPNGSLEGGTAGQYQYLRRMLREIERGEQRLDGTLGARMQLYVQAGRATYERALTLEMLALGYDEERYVLAVADHCTSEDGPRIGCVERAEMGWVAIGSVPGIGEANCLANDRCTRVFRDTTTGRRFDAREQAA